MARAIHALLPPIEVAKGGISNCYPNRPEEWDNILVEQVYGLLLEDGQDARSTRETVETEIIPAPFIQISLGTTEDRLLGSVNVEECINDKLRVSGAYTHLDRVRCCDAITNPAVSVVSFSCPFGIMNARNFKFKHTSIYFNK